MTKCHKDPTCGIFLERGFFRGIKYNILMCQMHKYNDIVYIMPTIGWIFVFCWVSLGPSGPGYGGMQISLSLHRYCVYHANNWIDICILLGFFGPFGPWVWGMYISLSLHWYCIYHANNWRCICILLGWHRYCICHAYEGREIFVFCLGFTDIVLYILHIIKLYYYTISYTINMIYNV